MELIEQESLLRKEIESAIESLVGKHFTDYEEMSLLAKDAIKQRLEFYGVKNNWGEFKVEYDIFFDFTADDNMLNGYKVNYVWLDEDYYI